jgi:serine protease inhibitor
MWNRRNIVGLPLWLLVASVSCCTKSERTAFASQNSGQKQTTPVPADSSTAAAEINGIGLRIFAASLKVRQVGNVVVSPVSLAVALQMAASGAAGRTEESFRQGLRLESVTMDEASSNLGALVRLLNRSDASITLSTVSGLWLASDIRARASYINAQRGAFQARVEMADFRNPATLDSINRWFAASTKNLIPNMLSNIPLDTRVLLANALYFKGNWQVPFSPSRTAPGPFYVGGRRVRQLQLMHHSDRKFVYTETADYQRIRLPFANGDFELIIVLPRQGLDASSWAARLGESGLLRLFESGSDQKRRGDIALPRLQLSTAGETSAILDTLGFGEAFGPNADFSRLATSPIKLSHVIHRVVLKWDEKGAEAAAGTGLVEALISAQPNPRAFKMIVDRPFVLALRHVLTGTLIVGGLVNNPFETVE